jgi:threonine dehydrogenase-like Zn-dependent dehydrogenase
VLQVALSGGEVRVVEVPEPVVRRGAVLVRTSHSLISAGTESAGIGSGGRRENLVLKAIRNPMLVKKVVDRVASHGLQATAELVRTRIANELPSGYSSAGVVIDVGEDVGDIRKGDRVACAGAGYANHAGVNVVPRNLVALVPDGVSFEEAAFGTLGAIALQGVRRAEPGLGDRVAVPGPRAARPDHGADAQVGRRRRDRRRRAAGPRGARAGARPRRRLHGERARVRRGRARAHRRARRGRRDRDGSGGDAGLLNKAFEACRRKGRVVLVGDVPIRIQRDKIYKKEIDFLISTSYGPGRYDASYEEKGQDYPFGYVRWTEGRNLQEVLRQIQAGALRVKPLIDATHGVEDASAAYLSLASENRPIGVLLTTTWMPPPRPRAPPPIAPCAGRPRPRRPGRSAWESSATAATSARCCCRC